MARASTRRPCQCWREDSESALHLLTSCRITKKLLKKSLQTLTIVFDQNHGLQHLKCKWRSCVLTISFPPSGASQLSSVWRVNKCLSPALKGRTLHPPSKIASQWLMLSGLSPPHIFHKVQIISPQPCKTKCTCGRASGHSEKKKPFIPLICSGCSTSLVVPANFEEAEDRKLFGISATSQCYLKLAFSGIRKYPITFAVELILSTAQTLVSSILETEGRFLHHLSV